MAREGANPTKVIPAMLASKLILMTQRSTWRVSFASGLKKRAVRNGNAKNQHGHKHFESLDHVRVRDGPGKRFGCPLLKGDTDTHANGV